MREIRGRELLFKCEFNLREMKLKEIMKLLYKEFEIGDYITLGQYSHIIYIKII